MIQDDNYVVADRAGVIENRYKVHAAVVDSDGALLFAVGDPSWLTMVRSAYKPMQALAILETGAAEKFKFDDADLALMCASHSSEERHISRAREMLRMAGNQESHLRCGGHPAVSPAVNRGWIEKGFTPTGVYNNCSGKHAGMLAGARAIGADPEEYNIASHPMQLRVKQVVGDLCGVPPDSIKWGIDGCNLPVPALPLRNMALMFAAFADAASLEDTILDGLDRPKTMTRIFRSMVQYPELVAGENRFCTVLMKAFGGQLIGKIGAEACYGIGVRASDDTRRLGAKGGIGIAMKVEDGNLDMLYAAVPELLDQLKIGTPRMREELESFHHPKRLNTMGVEVGKVSFPFKVRAVT